MRKLSAVNARGEMCFMIIRASSTARAPVTVWGPQRPLPIFLVVDEHPAHKSKFVRD